MFALVIFIPLIELGFPYGLAGKESSCNAEDLGLIPGRRESLSTPIFWAREFHGLYSPWSRKELNTIELLSLSHGKSLFNTNGMW